MLRHRVAVLASWLVVVTAGIVAATDLPSLLANSLAVPGTDSDRARAILRDHFGEPDDGVFTVVFRRQRSDTDADKKRLEQRVVDAADVVPTGRAGELFSRRSFWANITTALDLPQAKGYTDDLRRALRAPGERRAFVTGQPAIQHDLDPVFAADLRRGELIAVGVALVALLLVFGLSPAVLVPFAIATATISGTLLAVYALAQELTMVTYVTNLVALIGFALAVDYSLLIVFRFREEVARGESTDGAIVRTMATAGRSVVVSGLAVALGLGLLAIVPVPMMRSLGFGGLLIPLASIAAAVTLQPVLLSLLGPRGVLRRPRHRAARRHPDHHGRVHERGGWTRWTRTIMRRPIVFLASSTALLLAAAFPALWLEVTPGSISSIPGTPESVRGYELLSKSIGPGGITPVHVVVDAGAPGAARTRSIRAAVDRLADLVFKDPEVKLVATDTRKPFVEPSGRYTRLLIAGRHEFGDKETQHFVERLRDREVPAARFPAGARVYVGGAPAQGLDFLERSYGAFVWLVIGLLALTYVILLRAFRSLLLPLKAVLLNLLSVAAAYGLLVVIFRWNVGTGLLGLHHADAIEGWVPIFLFAALFGISMDYEVFMVSRMREAWDAGLDNTRAVAHGLQRTGPIVTAAAAIMIGAFSGFAAGRVAGLEQFGVGLVLAVFIDATIVRAILLPSAMAILGRWNWWLPGWAARVVRVEPSTLRQY
jgi:uncharacterized membrane protein YdfJ with MMPL/SSD domain